MVNVFDKMLLIINYSLKLILMAPFIILAYVLSIHTRTRVSCSFPCFTAVSCL